MGTMRKANDWPTERALRILEYVASSTEPPTIATIAAASGLPVPTTHRITAQLEDCGYLGRALGSKRLVVGPRLGPVGLQITAAFLKTAPRHAIIASLARKVGEHCALCVTYNTEIVFVESVHTVPIANLKRFEQGDRAPIHCTATGKLFLAHLPTEELHRLLRSLTLERFTRNTIVEHGKLLNELRAIKRRGWSSANEEYVPGMGGCSVPVFGAQRKLIAGISVTVPLVRVSFKSLHQYVPALHAAAAQLSSLLMDTAHSDDAR